MDSRRTEFWVLVPPLGDGGPAALQSALFRGGVLACPPSWSFSTLASRPEKAPLREHLPVTTGDWVLTGGWLALETSLPAAPPSPLFPSGLWILGQASGIPDFPPPCFTFRSLRAQLWQWTPGPSGPQSSLEISLLEDFRIGSGVQSSNSAVQIPPDRGGSSSFHTLSLTSVSAPEK